MEYPHLFVVFVLITTLTACGKEAPKVGIDQLISNQSTGKTMAMANAHIWMTENVIPDGAVISADIDSAMKTDCPQGDGYATVKIMVPVVTPDGKVIGQREFANLQCRTYGNTGCFTTKDAPSKSNYHKDQCDKDLLVIFSKGG
jgi:hypothetical protein